MENLNVVCGLPRAGSTLICNILAQNPKYYVGSTSILPGILGGISSTVSNSLETKSDLISEKDTYDKIRKSMKAFTDAWFADRNKDTVFDKSRGWNYNIMLLRELYPNSKIIIPVRDLREVFASVEKQHNKTPLFDTATTPIEKTILQRADQMFSNDGIIGASVLGVQDIIRRFKDDKNIMFIRLEDLANTPDKVIESLNTFLGDDFKYDLKNIGNHATDVDGLYLNKFPHKTQKEVYPLPQNEWDKYMTEDLAKLIYDKYPNFNEAFDYKF